MECISNKFLVDCADKMVYMCILCTEMTASNAKRQCNEKKKTRWGWRCISLPGRTAFWDFRSYDRCKILRIIAAPHVLYLVLQLKHERCQHRRYVTRADVLISLDSDFTNKSIWLFLRENCLNGLGQAVHQLLASLAICLWCPFK